MDISTSPQKYGGRNVRLFAGQEGCRMVTLESLENPFIIPLLVNCKKDNLELISSWMPYAIQKTGTFIIDLDSLGSRKDVFCDNNGAWTMKGNREKLYCVTRNFEGQVSLLYKVSSEADISVRRCPYICKSYPEFHKTFVTIEYGKSSINGFLWH